MISGGKLIIGAVGSCPPQVGVPPVVFGIYIVFVQICMGLPPSVVYVCLEQQIYVNARTRSLKHNANTSGIVGMLVSNCTYVCVTSSWSDSRCCVSWSRGVPTIVLVITNPIFEVSIGTAIESSNRNYCTPSGITWSSAYWLLIIPWAVNINPAWCFPETEMLPKCQRPCKVVPEFLTFAMTVAQPPLILLNEPWCLSFALIISI